MQQGESPCAETALAIYAVARHMSRGLYQASKAKAFCKGAKICRETRNSSKMRYRHWREKAENGGLKFVKYRLEPPGSVCTAAAHTRDFRTGIATAARFDSSVTHQKIFD